MLAAKYKVIIEQGGTFVKTFAAKRLTATGPLPFDLTGCTFAGRVKARVGAADTLATFVFAIDADPTTGLFTMSLTAPTTTALPANPPYVLGVYTVKLTTPSFVQRILEGEVELSPDV